MDAHEQNERSAQRAPLLACLLLLTGPLGLAGCLSEGGGGPSRGADDAAFNGLTPVATRDTGVIRGVVINEAIVPVQAARVAIQGTAYTTESNDAGAFAFDRLAPGTYILDVSKEGFTDQQVSAEVVAGDSTPDAVRVVLARTPGMEPYVDEHRHNGYIWCAYMIQSVQMCDLRGTSGQDRSHLYMRFSQPPTFIQSEMVWRSTQSLGDNMQLFALSCLESEGACDYTLCRQVGGSPLVCRIPKGGEGEWTTGIDVSQLGKTHGLALDSSTYCYTCSPASVGFAFQQTYDLYTHAFYNFEPPAEWQFSVDGAPKVPTI